MDPKAGTHAPGDPAGIPPCAKRPLLPNRSLQLVPKDWQAKRGVTISAEVTYLIISHDEEELRLLKEAREGLAQR